HEFPVARGEFQMAARTFHNLINGAWVPSHTGRVMENLNPADTRDVVGTFPLSDARDVEDAVAAARCAWEKWRLVPAPRRAEIVFEAARILAERKEECARDMTREMGKV